ncbi:hypothetical protein E2C01_013979 [Portunus trituberculatus]|uniref:Uncharacterized protein n=1 Tax=Portunus trituberculatus TaxID=210409 RepID=A0A5B7DIU7_PORTR|nr:hypothetical protein [Portunus trituberculatus]
MTDKCVCSASCSWSGNTWRPPTPRPAHRPFTPDLGLCRAPAGPATHSFQLFEAVNGAAPWHGSGRRQARPPRVGSPRGRVPTTTITTTITTTSYSCCSSFTLWLCRDNIH